MILPWGIGLAAVVEAASRLHYRWAARRHRVWAVTRGRWRKPARARVPQASNLFDGPAAEGPAAAAPAADGLDPERNVVAVGHAHPETSRAAAERALPRSGSWRGRTLDAICARYPGGLCDWEQERLFRRKHEAQSATRNSLMNDGLVEDSGERRPVPDSQNLAIVWRATPRAMAWWRDRKVRGA